MSKRGFKRVLGSFVLGAIVIVGGIGVATCLEKVPAGYSGVVYSLNGGVTGEVLGQGMHLLSPFEHVAKYPVSTETMYLSRDAKDGSKDDDSFGISTKDGKLVNVDVELSYHYEHDKLDEVYTKWRGKSPREIEDTYIKARVKAIANEVTSQYGVMDVYGEKRTELNQNVSDKLSKVLAEDGIVLETFTFTRIEPDAKTQEAIQSKVDAQQKLEQDKVEAERVKVEAEKKLISAQADADAKRIQAEADAQAQLIRAEAEAKANKLVNDSLTDKVLNLKHIQKWSGEYPQVMGNGVNPIVDLKGN